LWFKKLIYEAKNDDHKIPDESVLEKLKYQLLSARALAHVQRSEDSSDFTLAQKLERLINEEAYWSQWENDKSNHGYVAVRLTSLRGDIKSTQELLMLEGKIDKVATSKKPSKFRLDSKI